MHAQNETLASSSRQGQQCAIPVGSKTRIACSYGPESDRSARTSRASNSSVKILGLATARLTVLRFPEPAIPRCPDRWGIVRKGSLFFAECLVQEIFDEIVDLGARCAQVGVVVAHFAARCPFVHSAPRDNLVSKASA